MMITMFSKDKPKMLNLKFFNQNFRKDIRECSLQIPILYSFKINNQEKKIRYNMIHSISQNKLSKHCQAYIDKP